MGQSDFTIGKPYMSPISEKVFVPVKFYDDGGILFQSTDEVKNSGTKVEGHKFKLREPQYKKFELVDVSDCKDSWW